MAESAHIIAVANQKGGVGKTTTVINLGAYLCEMGNRVLLVDADPQCNTSRSLTPTRQPDVSLYDILVNGTAASEAVSPTTTARLDLLAASPDLAASEIELLDRPQRELLLKLALARVAPEYDYIFLDCPPSLGLLTVNALVAAQSVIVPVQCEYLALEGVSRLMDTVARIRSNLNPRLAIFGLLMTMFDIRTSLSVQVASDVRRHYPDLTFETVIPRNVRLSEAPSFGLPIVDYDPLSSGAKAYWALAVEVAGRG